MRCIPDTLTGATLHTGKDFSHLLPDSLSGFGYDSVAHSVCDPSMDTVEPPLNGRLGSEVGYGANNHLGALESILLRLCHLYCSRL